jgi:arylsulfatase A
MKHYFRLLGMIGFLLTGCQPQGSQYPNIVIIYADDLGYGDISCQNMDSKIATPHIDQLAAAGIRFSDAHSSAAVCTPSRYSLLTGRYCWRTELKKGVLWCWDKPLIKKGRLTLARMLREKGYQTAAIGKWHLGWTWPTTDGIFAKQNNGQQVDYTRPLAGGPNEYGFDYYFGDDVPNFPPYTFIENDRVTEIPTVLKPDSLYGQKGIMVEGWKLDAVMPAITEKAVSYITQAAAQNNPFFLYFPLTAPHDPVAPAQEFKGSSQAGLYGDYVREVDWTVGRVVDILERAGAAKNTLVIFTSDNGAYGGDGTNGLGKLGSVRRFGHSPNGPLRGFKGDIWEAGHRIPMIVKWPEKIKPGQVRTDLICQVDFMATLANLIGYDLPADAAEDSFDFTAVFLDEEYHDPVRETLVNHSVDGSFALRKGNWKLIFTDRSGGFSNGLSPEGFGIETPGQLYNLADDLGEKLNLYEQYPKMVRELTILLDKIKNDGKSHE